MPRATNRRTPRRRPNPPAVGPYNLSTLRLPGGSELEALSLGFSREEALDLGRTEGYANANLSATQAIKKLVERSNQLLVQDTSNAYIILMPDQNGPLARSVNMASLRAEFDADLTMGGLPNNLTEAQFKHQLDQKLNMTRGQSAFKGVPGDHNFKAGSIYIARLAQARNTLPKTYTPLRIKH